MLDRACAAKVVIYGHVSKTKVKPFQYGRTHYEVRLKSVVNRFPAHRVHHSETIIAVVAFSLRSLSKDRHTKANHRDDVAVAMTTQNRTFQLHFKNNFVGQTLCTLYYAIMLTYIWVWVRD